MEKKFVFGTWTALVLLAALVFLSCPVDLVEDEVPANGFTIRLTNIPSDVFQGNNYGFLAVFTDKSNIRGRGDNILQPLTGEPKEELKGLKLNFLNIWRTGDTLIVPSFRAIVDEKTYVLVLGLSPDQDEQIGVTYTTKKANEDKIGPITLNIDKGGVAEIDFSNFKNTGSREYLLENIDNL
jgi:hypothetical protein